MKLIYVAISLAFCCTTMNTHDNTQELHDQKITLPKRSIIYTTGKNVTKTVTYSIITCASGIISGVCLFLYDQGRYTNIVEKGVNDLTLNDINLFKLYDLHTFARRIATHKDLCGALGIIFGVATLLAGHKAIESVTDTLLFQ